jgi:REP element-mobilizing transposase RayT
MPQSLANILLHITFSTKGRRALIVPALAARLEEYVAAICRNHECPSHDIGGTENHLHIGCSLSRKMSCASLVEEVKVGSSKWIKRHLPPGSDFAWQGGYGAFSVDPSQLAGLKRYIRGQAEHHRQMTFEEEFRALLEQHHVPYDERYCWD